MIIEVNPNNSTDLYSLASQKQQVLQSHVLSIPSTGWTEDSTTHIWSYTANFSPDFGAEIGLFDNPNLIASYTIPQGDMSNYNKCASCNVRVASIVLDNPSNYSAVILADLQPDINISLDFIIYGKNDSVGDKASDSVSQYIIEHCIAQYQASFAYKVGNMCYQDGVLYKCIKNTTNNMPPNTEYWTRFDQNILNRITTLENNYATVSVGDNITKTTLGNYTMDVPNLIKFTNGAPGTSTVTIGSSSTPVYVNAGVLTACSNIVNTDGVQTITGDKTMRGRLTIAKNPFIKESGPAIFMDDTRSSKAYLNLRDSTGTNILCTLELNANGLKCPTPSVAGLNDTTVPTMAYLNNPDKATYLLHRAGAETITGAKYYTQQVHRQNSDLPVRTQWADSNKETAIIRVTEGTSSHSFIGQFDTPASRSIEVRMFNPKDSTWSKLGLMTNSEQYYAMAPTPGDNAPNDAIVTKGYAKMVTTDTVQTITGGKDFVLARIKNSLETKVGIPSNQVQTQPHQLIDKNNEQVMFQQILTNTNGTRQYRTNLFSTNGVRQTIENMFVYPDGTGYCTAINPRPDAPSNAIVTKAEVYGTNNLSNNLVHTISNESIDGVKTFNKTPCMGLHEAGSSNIDGWRKLLISPSFAISKEYEIAIFDIADNHGKFGTFRITGRNGAIAGFNAVIAGYNPEYLRATRSSDGEVIIWGYSYRSVTALRMEVHTGSSLITFRDSGTLALFDEPTTDTYAQVVTPTGV